MSSLEIIAKRLAEEQDRILERRDYVGETKSQLSFSPSAYSPRRQRHPAIISVGAALAAAAAVTLVLMPSSVTVEADGVGLDIGDWIASVRGKSTQLEFSDGSRIQLESDSGLRIQNLHPDGAHLLLERGTVDARVIPRPGADWKLDVGPYLVTITGTRFHVSWNPELRELSLKIREGSVRVEGPMISSGADLFAGDNLHASLIERRLEISAESEKRAAASADGAETALFPAPDPAEQEVELGTADDLDRGREKDEPFQATHRRATWRELAKQGRYADAVIQAKRVGVTRIMGSASAPDLMALGDAARHAGKQRLAVMVYTSVRERFPDSSHASSAAFSLGKMAFDKRRAYQEAARWFRACLKESKTDVLDKEASGRLMEALRLAGDERGAREEAVRYLRRFPLGPHAPLAKKLAADLR